jgi:hypothetical protein
VTTTFRPAEALAISEAATPGPWRTEPGWNNTGMPTADFYIPGHNGAVCVELLAADARLIAYAALRCPACTLLRSAPQFAPWPVCQCKAVRS